LYRSTISDKVRCTHLTVVNACFEQNAIWSLGLLFSLELILKNYPENDIKDKIVSAFIKSFDIIENVLRKEAESVLENMQGKTKEVITVFLRGEGSSLLSKISLQAKVSVNHLYL